LFAIDEVNDVNRNHSFYKKSESFVRYYLIKLGTIDVQRESAVIAMEGVQRTLKEGYKNLTRVEYQ